MFLVLGSRDHRRQSRHPCDIRRPIATLDGLKCRKSEIGDIFLFPAGRRSYPPAMFTFLVAAGAAPWTRGAFPPIGVLSYGHH
jgi:hypothetical protein